MRFSSINFTCDNCGAPLRFSPASGNLACEFCNTSTKIDSQKEYVQEYDLQHALSKLETNRPKSITKELSCNKCGVTFELTPYSATSNCPYCDTPAITEFVNNIKPESIIPFVVTHKEAKDIFAKWIGSLWLAPSELKELVDTDKELTGYYLPYWTYDSDTTTNYRGQRGDIYYVTVTRARVVNGKEQLVKVQEPRIRWSSVSGRVYRYFDDMTIEASMTISRQILANLGSWDTSLSKPFDTKYLSGFESQEYAIGLDSGYEMAKAKMSSIIKRDINMDIGGDRQQIEYMQTTHKDTTFKNALFPVWTTHFEYKGKTYHYAINGQSGEIAGDRPYSSLKIFIIVGFILAVVAGIGYYAEDIDASFGNNIYMEFG